MFPTISLYDFYFEIADQDIFKVTINAHSLNNGDIPTFIFIRAHCITSIKQQESKRIIRTLLLRPWLWVTYQQTHAHLKRYDEVDNHPF